MNKFFTKIEKILKKKVIICGHPKMQMKKNFYSRKTIYNKSINLAKSSALCMYHNSFALNYSILDKKPFILLFADEMKKTIIYDAMFTVASFFKKNLININNFNKKQIIDSLKVDEKLYAKYIDGYLAEKNVSNNRWSFIENKLRKLINEK